MIHGKGVSAGVVMGPLYFYRRTQHAIHRYEVEDAVAEWTRFKAAQEKVLAQLDELSKKARAEARNDAAQVLEIHRMMAEDPEYEEAIRAAVLEAKLNADAAVTDAAAQFANFFTTMEDPCFQARAADIKDVSSRLIAALTGAPQGGIAPPGPVPVILAADDLAPSEAAQLDRRKILGFITEGGSGSSHTAILARSMGISAVIGTGGQLKTAYEGRETIMDGGTGVVAVDVDANTKDRMLKKMDQQIKRRKTLEILKGLPNETKDGKTIKIYCNIASPDDVPAVLENDGGGVGLFRSEFLYLNHGVAPTEDAQFEAYQKTLSAMGGKEVVIRTLDIGADKRISSFSLPKEENPALGSRGLRVCLDRPEVFRTQLRALYRASAYGKLCIMFPMVASVWEVREAKKMCERVKAELAQEGIPFSRNVEIGIMIETPAAVLISDRLAKEVDFFSCGTNDLTQYILACDRQNADLRRFCDPRHPAVLRALKMVCDNAHKNGVWVGICGELGADLDLTETFISMGIDELSVPPNAVLSLRQKIRETNVAVVKEKLLEKLFSEENTN